MPFLPARRVAVQTKRSPIPTRLVRPPLCSFGGGLVTATRTGLHEPPEQKRQKARWPSVPRTISTQCRHRTSTTQDTKRMEWRAGPDGRCRSYPHQLPEVQLSPWGLACAGASRNMSTHLCRFETRRRTTGHAQFPRPNGAESSNVAFMLCRAMPFHSISSPCTRYEARGTRHEMARRMRARVPHVPGLKLCPAATSPLGFLLLAFVKPVSAKAWWPKCSLRSGPQAREGPCLPGHARLPWTLSQVHS